MELPDTLAERLKIMAEREGRDAHALLQTLLDDYEKQHLSQTTDDDPLAAFIGAFDDDVTDLSVTVRDTLKQRFKT